MSWLSPRRIGSVVFLFVLLLTTLAFGQGAKIKTPGKWIDKPDDREANEQNLIRERQKWFMKGRQAPKGETPAGMRIKSFENKTASASPQ
jgi:hypothetical protein